MVKQTGCTVAGNMKEFIGLSTDTKPTTDCGAGSTFWELDLKKPYIFDGTTWWEV